MKKVRVNQDKLFEHIGYIPQDTQAKVHRSPARFKIDVRGRRSGKTYGSGRHCLPDLFTPGTRGCVLAPTYDLCDKLMREIDKICFQQLKLPIFAQSKIRGSLRYAKLKLGPTEKYSSEVWARTADNPDSILGEGYDWAIVDEASRVSRIVIEQYLRPTLSERRGWALYVSTPNGFNWYYDYYERGQSDDPEWEFWKSWRHPTSSSKYISPEELQAAMNELSADSYAQEYGAEFRKFVGQVYGDFSRTIHAKYHLLYDRRYNLYTFIDFGYRMPAVLWAQIVYTETGPKLVIIDEIIHVENISSADLKHLIIRRNEEKGYEIAEYYCDPAGLGKQTATGLSDIEVFKQRQYSGESISLKYRTDKDATNIQNGIKFIRALMYNAAGKISLFVSSNCTGIIRDLEGYSYPKTKLDVQNALPENPVKDGKFEHGCDALRMGAINLASSFKELVYIKGLVN